MNLKLWRPQRFADIVGAVNQPNVRRLQAVAKQRSLLKGILVGTTGTAKTSVARLLLKSYLCLNRDPLTADPCHECRNCRNANSAHSGERFNFEYWEVDCSQHSVNREYITGLVRDASDAIVPPFLIFDELQRLHEEKAQGCLLTFTHDLSDGVFLAATMADFDSDRRCPTGILPALYDRLSKFHFQVPKADEIANFLWAKLDEWNITSTPTDIHELVLLTHCSFRDCLDKLQAAREINDGKLDTQFLAQLCGEKEEVGCPNPWIDPFANEE
jgi:replication-associated recombination protein RarA